MITDHLEVANTPVGLSVAQLDTTTSSHFPNVDDKYVSGRSQSAVFTQKSHIQNLSKRTFGKLCNSAAPPTSHPAEPLLPN